VICAAVYVELRGHPQATAEFVDTFLNATGILIDFETQESLWRETARAFAEYAGRRRGTVGTTPKRLLADFLIGAHAWLASDRLMTLDPARYAQDFPKLALVNQELH